MTEPKWISVRLALSIHAEQLLRYGGPQGLRDGGLLESALGRAKNRWAYEGGDLADLAAAYAYGIARNHPFIDGNKRAALLVALTFLGINGVDFHAPEAEAVVAMLRLAAGEIEEEGLARWVRDRSPEGAFAR
jgi:death on curing protein